MKEKRNKNQFNTDLKAYLESNNLSIIKHIPHASLKLPSKKIFLENVTKYIYKMADIGVDDLFCFIPGIEIKAKYSRIFCDVERFKDDEKEPMSKLGQGYIYHKTFDGKDLFRRNEYRGVDYNQLANHYYDYHHALLNKITKQELDKGKNVLILDLHSYSEEQANSLGKSGPYPDICIGINEDFNHPSLLDFVIKIICKKGYSYQINYPYCGAIVPSGVMNGSIKGNVTSIMIEVNKKLYL